VQVRVAVVAGAAALGLVACTPVAAPAPPTGPTLQVVTVNQTTERATFSHAFESENMVGEGETTIEPCASGAFTVGEVAGTLTVRVNGDVVAETHVPLVSRERAYVVRIHIQRDGDVFATAPALAADLARVPPQPVACGPE
jgi:hypothetical protein